MLTILENTYLNDLNTINNQSKWCYKRLADFAYADKSFCFPGKKNIADKMGISVRQVDRYINALVKNNLIKKTRRGKKETNYYYFPLKSVGIALNKAIKKAKQKAHKSCSESDTTLMSYEYNKDFITDDLSAVADVLKEFLDTEETGIVEEAAGKIKNLVQQGNKITVKGFKKYLSKVIATLKIQKSREKIFKKNHKTKKVSTFCNYEGRGQEYYINAAHELDEAFIESYKSEFNFNEMLADIRNN